MKTFWVIPFVALASCNPSSKGGSESNFVTCKSTSDCRSGFVCGADRCERAEAGVPSSGGGSAIVPPATGGAGGNSGAGSGGTRSKMESDASLDGDAVSRRDGSVRADAPADGSADGTASVAAACFDVRSTACGAIAAWSSPSPSANGWTVYRAIPIEGTDGLAALLGHGAPGTADWYAFATLGADGGCAKLAAPLWSQATRFAGISRAVSRGGTFAFVGQCVQRFGCGATLFLNGAEWTEPLGQAYFVDVDVASDGRVLVVSSFPGDSATSADSVERWLSPTGQILAERRFHNVQIYDIDILDDGTIALATNADGTGSVRFQSATLGDTGEWDAGANRLVTSLAEHFPLLAMGGTADNSAMWTGVLDAQKHAEIWSHTRTDLQGALMAVEIDAAGAIDASVWQGPFGFASFLLLHDTKTAPGVATAPFNPNYPPGPARVPAFGAIRTEPDGRILFSTDFLGTYCEKD